MSAAGTRRCLVAAALVVTGLAACGDDDDSGTAADAEACGTLPSKDPAATALNNVPTIGDVLYEPSRQGKTKIVFELVEESDFVKVRDELVEKLRTKGWTIDGTDQESVEAEAQFSKTPPLVAGTIKVEPLCKGYVTIRYKLSE